MKTSLLSLLLCLSVYCRAQTESNQDCYIDSLPPDDDHAFILTEIGVSFKDGSRSFDNFLIRSIRPQNFIDSISSNEVHVDSARIQFIVTSNKKVSKIRIKKVANPRFEQEIRRVMLLSSCNWIPAESSGRLLTSWAEFYLYCITSKTNQGTSTSIHYKWSHHANLKD